MNTFMESESSLHGQNPDHVDSHRAFVAENVAMVVDGSTEVFLLLLVTFACVFWFLTAV